QPERGISTGRVSLDRNRVQVAALTGSFRVVNARGTLIANLGAGAALAFEPQASPTAATRITGVLRTENGHFLVTHEVTNVTVEVGGSGLPKAGERRVETPGTADPAATPVSGTSQLIRVTQIRRVPATGSGGAAPAGSGGSSAAISGTTIAIIGGV